MVPVFFTLDQAQGMLAQSILLSEGIEVFSPNMNTVAIGYGNSIGGIELLVKRTDQERALQVLKEKGLVKD